MSPLLRLQLMFGYVLLCLSIATSLAEPQVLPAYTDHRDLLYFLDADGRRHAVDDVRDWRKRRRHILLGMQQAMGPLPSREHRPAPNVTFLASDKGDGYVRHAIRFDAAPDTDHVTTYLYIPQPSAPGVRHPAMLALHPTHPLGKGVVDGQSERPNRAYARELAQRGYIVIAPDYISFGDLKAYDFHNDDYISGTMKGIVNHMRSVDVLVHHRHVDPERIGVIGHSLGGHNAMFLAVFDPRIKVIVSSCGWTPFHDYYDGNIAGWTSERYMPRLKTAYGLDADRVPFDFYEIVAALAPRPFFSNAPLHDDNFDIAGVRKVEAEARKVYMLYGAADHLQVVYPDCGHDFPREIRLAAYRMIDEHLEPAPQGEAPAAP